MGWGILLGGAGVGLVLWSSDMCWLMLGIPAVPLIGFALHAAARGR